jgi:hypothetical protein
MPAWVYNEKDLMTRYGLRWGGEYTGTPDPMHFEFMLTPADADSITASLGGGEWWEMPIGQPEIAQIKQACADALNDWDSKRPPPLAEGVKPQTLTEAVNGVWGGGIPKIVSDTGKILSWTVTTQIPTAQQIADAVVAELPSGSVELVAITAAFKRVLNDLVINIETDPTGATATVEDQGLR